MMKTATTVTLAEMFGYDRSQKTWWAENYEGQRATFGPGKAAKAKAKQLALSVVSPGLYEDAAGMVRRYPELESRVWRAADILLDPEKPYKLIDSLTGPAVASFESLSNPGVWHGLISVGDSFICSCQDDPPATDSGRKYCKHAIAYLLELRRVERANAPY